MFNYQKTQLGLDALQQRTRDLNARQRRLLVLIGTKILIYSEISLSSALHRLN